MADRDDDDDDLEAFGLDGALTDPEAFWSRPVVFASPDFIVADEAHRIDLKRVPSFLNYFRDIAAPYEHYAKKPVKVFSGRTATTMLSCPTKHSTHYAKSYAKTDASATVALGRTLHEKVLAVAEEDADALAKRIREAYAKDVASYEDGLRQLAAEAWPKPRKK